MEQQQHNTVTSSLLVLTQQSHTEGFASALQSGSSFWNPESRDTGNAGVAGGINSGFRYLQIS
jgi:hypothetical protein